MPGLNVSNKNLTAYGYFINIELSLKVFILFIVGEVTDDEWMNEKCVEINFVISSWSL